METFFIAASFYYFLRILKDDRGWLRVIFFLATLTALYTDYYAWLGVLAQGIYLLTRRKYKFLILNSLFLILCYLPWLPMFLTQLKTGMLATQALPGWGELVNLSFFKAIPLTFVKFSIGRIIIFNKIVYAGVAGIIIGLYGFLILRTVRGWIKDKLKDGRGVLVVWFLLPLVTAWLVSLFVPNFQPFRLLLILPAFYLLLLFGIFSFKSKILRSGLVALVVIINLSSLAVYYFNPYFQREDWKGLVNFLKKQENSQVLLPSSTSDWPIRYYDQKNIIKLVYGAKGIAPINDNQIPVSSDWLSVISDQKVIYVRYLVPLFDPNEKILAELREAGYTKVKEVNFNQIPLWEYQKK